MPREGTETKTKMFICNCFLTFGNKMPREGTETSLAKTVDNEIALSIWK